MPLLQNADSTFLRRLGCVSCHNNSLTAMSVAIARSSGVAVDEQIARDQRRATGGYVENRRELVLQGAGFGGESSTVSAILLGLAAENYPPDDSTAAMTRYLRMQQAADGCWRVFSYRPPIQSSD